MPIYQITNPISRHIPATKPNPGDPASYSYVLVAPCYKFADSRLFPLFVYWGYGRCVAHALRVAEPRPAATNPAGASIRPAIVVALAVGVGGMPVPAPLSLRPDTRAGCGLLSRLLKIRLRKLPKFSNRMPGLEPLLCTPCAQISAFAGQSKNRSSSVIAEWISSW